MNFDRLLECIGDEPVFETALLLAGPVHPAAIHIQLSRWVKSGRILQLRRGLYSLAPPYQKIKPHPFLIANRMVRGSYVSCQTALAHYHLIPDVVQTVISVTTGRPGHWVTPLGVFQFHHIQPELFRGYHLENLGNQQQAFVAVPEKALLDLIYLTPGSHSQAYLNELRLQNLQQVDLAKYRQRVAHFSSQRIQNTLDVISRMQQDENAGYEGL